MDTRQLFAKYSDPSEFEKIKPIDTVVDMLNMCKREYSSLPAISDATGEYTYGQLCDDVAKFRHVLKENGVVSGQRVGLFSVNCYDLIKAFLAVVTYGCTALIMPIQFESKKIEESCDKFGLGCIVYHDMLSDRLEQIDKKIPLVNVKESSLEQLDMVKVDASSPCVIMFTGGSSGKNKGALLSHKSFMQGVVNGCYGIKNLFYQKYVLVLPLSHVFGLIRNTMTPLYAGCFIRVSKSPKDLFSDIKTFKPNILVLVPALVDMAINLSKKFKRNMLGDDVKTIICGAAHVSPYLIEECANIGITVFPGYGLTESANLVSGNPEQIKKPDSVGIPYPNQQLKIVNGELWLKGDNIMDGYVDEDEENKRAFEDGWFKTGDLVRFDEDGFLYITGRCKDIIVLSNGENVSPEEVETHFNALSSVQDSQVFECVLENGKHVLAVEVYPRRLELEKLGVTDIEEYVTEQLKEVNATLAPHMRVSKFMVRKTDFERNSSMKIVRYKNEIK